MPYDRALAARVRARLAGRSDVTEMDMMGGHQFLIGGRIAFSVRTDSMSVRVDPPDRERLATRAHVSPMRIGSRTTQGFLRVATAGLRSDRSLDEWIAVGLRAATLA